ncbi:hypothetical protein [Variovorax sp. JS1663]|uniref:hypothetical protein n=1 Tax=Variovorax sp. JS1663 TaxID=1851577 RepID=UPI000B3452F7|nr:hypothetical protein [Variovorax sp. JS1663]OUM02974.1 hypothetical protein A8M77_08515 [Variovorax sp. JS1663]
MMAPPLELTGGSEALGSSPTPSWHFYHWHAGAEQAYTLLLECLTMRDRDGNPRGLRIVGESRAGKSSFLANATTRLHKEHPELASGLYVSQPPLESRDIEGAIRQRELEGARHKNAPLHPKGPVLKAQSDHIWVSCTGFVWEEAHQFFLEKTKHFRMQSAAFFRLRMNEMKKPIIFLGTEVLHDYIRLSSELANRFRATAELGRYTLDNDAEEHAFVRLLADLEDKLPVTVVPSLQEPRMMLRCFCACNGLIGDLMDLTERAVQRAQAKGVAVIHQEDLADAFDSEFPERAAQFNPFDMDASDDKVVKAITDQAQRLKALRPRQARRRGQA